ncbi:glycosyltransferase [Jannaschia sp. R86511]|uniref:glycosyltransferase n=1 Tax=Jannaschia sp. R86511 TaxID=3093853 RepID=UPI0036D2B1DD
MPADPTTSVVPALVRPREGAGSPPGAAAVRPLGAVLRERGLLTDAELAWALEAHARTGSRLGDVLVSSGLVRRIDLYTALAEAWDLPFVDVPGTTLDPALVTGLHHEQLRSQGWLPVDRAADGRVRVAVTDLPDDALRERVETALGAPVDFAVTTSWDIAKGLTTVFRDGIVDDAANGLWRRSPVQSARSVLSRPQQVVGVVVAVLLLVAVVLRPFEVLVAASTVVGAGYLLAVAFKFVVSLQGARREQEQVVTDDEVAALADDELPVYTVLVPVFREANIVGNLVRNLGDLDYPKDKLEILLLLEEGDDETRDAAMAAGAPETVTFVTVPPGGPQTKPRACNVGLFFARGDLLVIYDAEDVPDRDQLKKSVVAFRRAREAGDDTLVCVQAALNYWNADENFLTRMFTLEYSFWFDYMLPGLDALRLPIPLGGTSNHFRTDVLRRLGGWDPYNVTEDADLGIRASAAGLSVGVVNSTTFEEANRAYGNWVRQRSRWIKGYMQTTLVHLRRPRTLVAEAGLVPTLGFAVLVGGTPLSFLFAPPLYAAFLFSLLVPSSWLGELFPGWVLWAAVVNLLLGNSLMIYVSMMGAFRRRRYGLVPWAILNPVYWLLHSVAAYKGLWQLITRPHYWEKTDHGLSDVPVQP